MNKAAKVLTDYLDQTGLFSAASSVYKLFSYAEIEDHRQKIDEAAHYRDDPFKEWFGGSDRVFLPYGEKDNSRYDKEVYLRNEFKDILEWIDKYTAESSDDASLLDGRLKSGRKIGGKFFLQVMKSRLNEFYNENHNKINVNVTEFVSIFSSLYGERDNQKDTWGADSGLISMVSERDIYNGNDFDRVGFLDKLSGIISDANIISRDYAASPARGNKKVKVKDYGIVITKEPTDVAAMSTGRRWTSCVNLDGGQYSSDVFCEIKAGSFVAYLIESDDINIERPFARARARRFDGQNGESVAILEDEVYSDGTEYPGFLEAVQAWINSHQGVLEYGAYHRRGGKWSDTFEKVHNIEKEYPKDLQTLSNIIIDPKKNLEEKKETYVVIDELFDQHEDYFSDGEEDSDEYGAAKLNISHLEEDGMSFGDYKEAEEWIEGQGQYWQSELFDFIEYNSDLSYEIDHNYEPSSDEEREEIEENAKKSPFDDRFLTSSGEDLMEYASNKDMRFKIKVDTAEEKMQREVRTVSRMFYTKLHEDYLAKKLNKTKLISDAAKKSIEYERGNLSPKEIHYDELSLTLRGYAVMFPEFFSEKELKKVFDKNKKELKDVAFDYSLMNDGDEKEERRREIISILESKLKYESLRLAYERVGYGGSSPKRVLDNLVSSEAIKILHDESPLPNSFSDKIIDLYKAIDRDDEFVENPAQGLRKGGKDQMRGNLLSMLKAMNAHNPRTIFFYREILSEESINIPADMRFGTELSYLIQTIGDVGISGEPLIPELERLFKEADKVGSEQAGDDYWGAQAKKLTHDFKRRIIFAIKAIRPKQL